MVPKNAIYGLSLYVSSIILHFQQAYPRQSGSTYVWKWHMENPCILYLQQYEKGTKIRKNNSNIVIHNLNYLKKKQNNWSWNDGVMVFWCHCAFYSLGHMTSRLHVTSCLVVLVTLPSSTLTNEDQRRPTQTNEGQKRPTNTNAGHRRLPKTNKNQPPANAGPQQQ